MTRLLAELRETGSFAVFESFVRRPGVRRWLKRELGLSDDDYAAALADLDYRRAELLPRSVGDIAPKTKKSLRAIFEFLGVQLRKKPDGWFLVRIGAPEEPLPSVAGRGLPGSVPDWHLALPVPPDFVELKKISPTRLDGYRRCPFTCYLRQKDVLGDRLVDYRADRLAPWEYGNVIHSALEAWGRSELRDSDDAAEIAAFLGAELDSQLSARFGGVVPPAVAEQGVWLKDRLSGFAAAQSVHRREGWSIAAVERRFEMSVGHTLVYGKCDRIDYNGRTGCWRVIDYKTWERAVKVDSLQLALYALMLDREASPEFANASLDRISYTHFVLGRSEEDRRFMEPEPGTQAGELLAETERIIARIERGIFWPPSPKEEWRLGFPEWLEPSPEVSIAPSWIADQVRRLSE